MTEAEIVKVQIVVGDLNSTKNQLKKAKGLFSRFGKEVQDVALGNLLAKGVEKGLGVLQQGLAKAADFLGDSMGKALRFEDELASARKSIGLTADETKALGKEILKLGRDTRTSVLELTDIATIGGQLGIARDDIVEFVESIDKLNVALGDEFSGGAEQITKEIGVLATVLKDVGGEDIAENILRIGNAVNVLGAEGLATGPVVSDMVARMASAGTNAGVASRDMLAFAATLEATGVNAQLAGGSMQRLFQILPSKAGDIVAAFRKFGVAFDEARFLTNVNEDLTGAILQVAEAATQAGLSNEQLAEFLDDTGLKGVGVSQTLQNIGKNTELFYKNQELAGQALGNTNSILDEFNIKNNTGQAALDKFNNKLTELQVSLGAPLAQAFMPIVDIVGDFFSENQEEIGRFAEDFGWALQRVIRDIPLFFEKTRLDIDRFILSLRLRFLELGRTIASVFGDQNAIDSYNRQIQGTVREMQTLEMASALYSQRFTEDLEKVDGNIARFTMDLQEMGVSTEDLSDTQVESFREMIATSSSYEEALGKIKAQTDELTGSTKTVTQSVLGFASTMRENFRGGLEAIQTGGVEGFKEYNVKKKNKILRMFGAAEKFQEGGIIGGGSFRGDQQLFAGNRGEAVITSDQLRDLFKLVKQLVATQNNTINATFQGSERGRGQEMNMLSGLLANI
jgi:TP901 family phage tail tape measure protein